MLECFKADHSNQLPRNLLKKPQEFPLSLCSNNFLNEVFILCNINKKNYS